MKNTRIDFDKGRHVRGRIGFVLLSSEQTVEDDMFTLIPRDVGVHFSRAPMPNAISPETLRDMEIGLAAAAALITPDAGLDVITYACTSGSICIGEERVIRELQPRRW